MTEAGEAGPGPQLPPPRPSWVVRAYTAFGVAVVLTYLAAGLYGWSFEPEDEGAIPVGVRQFPGGYRSYHLWHSGFQGGK